MSRNEKQTCRDLIEPAVADAGWNWDAQVEIGPGPVNLTGEAMYDPSQRIVADYLLKLWRMPLTVLEAKPEGEPASNGMQQASRYALRLGLRFSIASNGREYILTDDRTACHSRESGNPETLSFKRVRVAIWAHEIPCPPLAEQRRIVARVKECMERVDEIRALLARTSSETDLLMKTILARAFTGDL